MDLEIGTKSFSRIQKKSARYASPSVDTCGGFIYAYIYRYLLVIFFRPMGHYVRDISSFNQNISYVYHIVTIRVI
jgi:hypothetical protein